MDVCEKEHFTSKRKIMSSGDVKVMEKMKNDFQKLSCDDDRPESEQMLPLALKQLTPSLLKEAKEKLQENEDVKQKALAEFRSMIEAEKNLLCPMDDIFLLAFLRARKYDLKRTFKLFQNYWKFRKDYDKIFSNINFEEGVALLQHNFIGLLEKRDKTGCTVFVVKAGLWDPNIDSYDTLFRMVSAILVYSQEHEATQIAGFRAIFDFRGVTWIHMKYCTPSNILLLVRSTQFSFPARYKGVHILCESKLIKFIWGMASPLLTAKLKKRIFFHGEDLSPLKQYIHPSVLPEEFGGDAPTFKNGMMLEALRNRNNRVIDHLKYGYQD